jgi:hypothetical protein
MTAKAARHAIDILKSANSGVSDGDIFDAVRGWQSGCWGIRVHLNAIRRVLVPLAAWVVQGAWRRHHRLEKARWRIQNAVLDFLWRPHSWACREGAKTALTHSHDVGEI